jgi:hypothetical protein
MAKVYITEHYAPTLHNGNALAVAKFPEIAEQVVAIGGTTVQSSAFNQYTRMIGVHTDAICSFKIGSNPTATANTRRMAANATEYFEVNPGDKIAIITNT